MKSVRMTGLAALLAMALLPHPFPSRGLAGTFSWDNSESGNFDDPSKWFDVEKGIRPNRPNPDNKVPGAEDVIGFTRQGGAYTVNIASATVARTGAGPRIGGPTEPLTFNVAGVFSAGAVEGERLVLTGGGWMNAGDMFVYQMNVNNNSTLSAGPLRAVDLDFDGAQGVLFGASFDTADRVAPTFKGLVLQNGSRVNSSGPFLANGVTVDRSMWEHDGDIPPTGLKIVNSGSVSAKKLGERNFSSLVTMDGGSTFTVDEFHGLGLDIQGASTFMAREATLFGSFGDQAVVRGGGTTWDIRDQLTLNTAKLNVRDGATVKTTAIAFAARDLGSGTVEVKGSGSNLNVTGDVEGGIIHVKDGASATAVVARDASVQADGANSRFNGNAFRGDGNFSATNGGTFTVGTVDLKNGFLTVFGANARGQVTERLILGNGGQSTASVSAGGRLESEISSIGIGPNGNGTLNVADPGSVFLSRGSLAVGAGSADGSSAQGQVVVSQGARLEAQKDAVLGLERGTTGTLTVRGQGTETHIGGDLVIGNHGKGTLRLQDKAKVSVDGQIGIALQPDSMGTLILDGKDIEITSINDLLLAGQGQGLVELRNGAKLSLKEVRIGEQSGENTSGDLLIEGVGTQVVTTAPVTIGGQGKGLLRVLDGGGLTSRSDVVLGESEGSQAEAVICSDRMPSTWQIDGNLTIGAKGLVRTDVKKMANVRVGGDVIIGQHPGSDAILKLDGAQSTLTVAGQMRVGLSGKGVVEVLNGANLTADFATVSSSANPNRPERHGTLKVVGSPSSFLTEHWLTVGSENENGEQGRGELFVEDGGTVVTTEDAFIGRDANSEGEVNVTTVGHWQIRNNLYVGQFGKGSLYVVEGGDVTSGPLTIGAESSGEGTLNVGAGANLTADRMNIGQDGVGRFFVKRNGRVHSKGPASIGIPTGSGVESFADVAGTDATWQIDRSLDVHPHARLDVKDAGAVFVTSASILVRGNSSHDAKVNVLRENATLSANRLSIGNNGFTTVADTGTLLVENELEVGREGQLAVNNGTVNIGGGLNAVPGTIRVGPGGVLDGEGTIVGTVINAGGRVLPGSSPGRLRIKGDYVQTESGLLELEIAERIPAEQYDVLEVTGSATIGGSTILSFVQGFAPRRGDQFELISAANLALTGAVETRNLAPGFQFDVSTVGGMFLLTALNDAQFMAALQAGDADQDYDFDQFDLIRVLARGKYRTGQPATWGEGDWNGAPGGTQNSPPAGDGVFNQFDIIAAQQAANYLAGPYAALGPLGQLADNQTSVIYDARTGEVAVDAPAGIELTSINIDSAAGIFTGAAAQNLGGSFDNDADNNIFKATFGSSFGSLSFGTVAQAGLSEQFLLGDLTVVGSLAGGGGLRNVDLVYVPEPTTVMLTSAGVLGLVLCSWRRKFRS